MNSLLHLVAFAGVAVGQTVWQGFNSGNTLPDRSAKNESLFRQEFETMQSLPNSPGVFNAVRLYTNIQGSPETPSQPISAFQAAIDTNTSMLLGIWCSGTTNITNELDAMLAALDQFGQSFADLVIAISVGSEDLYRVSEKGIEQDGNPGTGPRTLVSFINDTRDAVEGTLLADKPITHVDTWLSWVNASNSEVIDAVDFISVDIYPFFEKDTTLLPLNLPFGQSNTFNNSVPIFEDLYERTVNASNGKDVWVTETGHPYLSEGDKKWGQSVASIENEKLYWQGVGCGNLFGRVNTFWYTLRDANPDSEQKFAVVTDDLSLPRFDLTCPAGSGAPATINANSSGYVAEQGGAMRSNGYDVAMSLLTFMLVAIVAL